LWPNAETTRKWRKRSAVDCLNRSPAPPGCLTRSPRAVGYDETAHHRRLLQDIKQAAYDSDLVAMCGVIGSGKTVTLRRLQEILARDNRVIVSKLDFGPFRLGSMRLR